jgi:cytochrome c biogenesis protein CcmG/thiol:disulfide interchange protein DsbE
VKHPARWIALGVGAVVVVLAVVLALNVGTDPQAATKRSRLLDTRAPAIDLVDFDGNPVTSDSLAGKTVIVNFWNEWCIPCVQELPELKKFWKAHANDSDVVMLGVVHDARLTKAGLAAFAQRVGMDWTLAMDPGQGAALGFAIRGQPETFAVAPSGVITGYQYGPATAQGLEAMLESARSYG